MIGQETCPLCQGRGVILDPDPIQPARPCTCSSQTMGQRAPQGLPNRYRNVTLESFWEWWKIQHPRGKILATLAEAHQALADADSRAPIHQDLRSKLELILHKCGPNLGPDGELTWRTLRPAQEPQGYGSLQTWTRSPRNQTESWWVDGPPGSGKSSLAAAALRAWCQGFGQPGLFVSVRAFSLELKDIYYDSRSFRNTDFLGERDRMAPLLRAPFLVLDDFDRMDSDLRVVRALAQLLDHRYNEELPTLVTAGQWSETLQATDKETFPLLRLEDGSLFRRLSGCKRVELRPTLDRLMESLDSPR